MKLFETLGCLVAIALIIFSIAYPVPDKQVYVSSYSYSDGIYSWDANKGTEYINGDAYNYVIEATLKAGYFTGVVTAKSITFVGGLLLLFISVYSSTKRNAIEEQTGVLNCIYGKIDKAS